MRETPAPREASKNQNPREGIETQYTCTRNACNDVYLQKTKIPARGLKLGYTVSHEETDTEYASKNQNPREGIETKT